MLSALPAALLTLLLPSLCLSGPEILSRPKRTPNGFHIPLYKRNVPKLHRRGAAQDTVGLGDDQDLTYNVLVNVGAAEIPLVLDTGSSDLWVISDDCNTPSCTSTGIKRYPLSNFQSSDLSARLFYGDSQTGTHAFGKIGKDIVGIAGLSIRDQYFAAINDTNTTVSQSGSAGIFGAGFPVNSVIWSELFKSEFPILRSPSHKRQSSSTPSLAALLNSFASNGPLLTRLATSGTLASPQFTITLQRDSIQVGGNEGMLSVGELPPGVSNSSLTWVPVRGYNSKDGGLESPTDLYPISWEIPIDDVFLDGQRLPASQLAPGISVSALIDTGNSLIRGPKDTVQNIISRLTGPSTTGTFSCSTPHTLAFQIGGKMFPVDPRDLIQAVRHGGARDCASTVIATDPPHTGFLYSWSLGDPFMKSNLVSFYFGNLTNPSKDPPRMGFLSTVQSDANAKYNAAISAAQQAGSFPAVSEVAPSTKPSMLTTLGGVPQAPTSTSRPSGNANGAVRTEVTLTFIVILSVTYLFGW